jgi:sterol desaturase/sphingolipid hydroxylase (fatty acid hydroxylase superfamily)
MNTEGVPLIALSLVLLAVVAEVIWSRRRGVDLYSRNETLASLAVGAMNRLGGLVTLAVKYAAIAFVARFVPWGLPDNAWTFIAGFLVVEVFYYWYHRINHEVPFLWALHHVHHSSPEYNMTTSIRLNVLSNLVGAVWFAPMALFGFSDTVILTTLSAALFFQFFLHTQAVPPLGRIEGWINTPSAHRVHHGSNDWCIDRNYAGTLAVLDRIFGTYQPEIGKVTYGVTTGHYGHNPIKLVFQPILNWATGKGWMREKAIIEQQAA